MPSVNSNHQYARPLKPGEMPIYDEALAYIQRDKEEKIILLRKAREQLEKASEEQEKSTIKESVEGLEVASEINDTETRWKFKMGLGQSLYLKL